MPQTTPNLSYLNDYGDENDEIETEEVGELDELDEYGGRDDNDEELDYNEEEF